MQPFEPAHLALARRQLALGLRDAPRERTHDDRGEDQARAGEQARDDDVEQQGAAADQHRHPVGRRRVGGRRGGGGHERAAHQQEARGVRDREHVEDGERRSGTARELDRAAQQHDVEDRLCVGERADRAHATHGERREQRERVGDRDRDEGPPRDDVARPLQREVVGPRRGEKHRDDEDAREEQDAEPLAQRLVPLPLLGGAHDESSEPSWKIGRYMAITNPPITVPRTTMTSGSINAVRFATATSTSSS